MTDQDTQTRTRNMMVFWQLFCIVLLAASAALVSEISYLRDELAKPVRLTIQQKSDVIKEYHANMTWETRYALRQFIGCTDKE